MASWTTLQQLHPTLDTQRAAPHTPAALAREARGKLKRIRAHATQLEWRGWHAPDGYTRTRRYAGPRRGAARRERKRKRGGEGRVGAARQQAPHEEEQDEQPPSTPNYDRHTTAPIRACCPVTEDGTHAPPLRFLGARHAAHARLADIVARARLLYNRAYTAAHRHLHPSALDQHPTDGTCPHAPCTAAGTPETVEHMLLDCPQYAAARATLANQLSGHVPSFPLTLHSILNPPERGRHGYRRLYDLTTAFLLAINAARAEQGMPDLNTRPQPQPSAASSSAATSVAPAARPHHDTG